jgi:Ubiquitin-binding domain
MRNLDIHIGTILRYQGALTTRRNQFWRSRTGGSAEIWLAIRTSAEALLADDVTLAAAILKVNTSVMMKWHVSLFLTEKFDLPVELPSSNAIVIR